MLAASLAVHMWASHSFDPGIATGNEYEAEEDNIIELTAIPEYDSNVRGQVVELPPAPDTEAPDEYDYLAERNSSVTFAATGCDDHVGSVEVVLVSSDPRIGQRQTGRKRADPLPGFQPLRPLSWRSRKRKRTPMR